MALGSAFVTCAACGNDRDLEPIGRYRFLCPVCSKVTEHRADGGGAATGSAGAPRPANAAPSSPRELFGR